MFLANYSDGLSDLPLAAYIDEVQRAGGAIASFVSVRPSQSFHAVRIGRRRHGDGDGAGVAVRHWINGGFFCLRREIFDYMKEGEELVDRAVPAPDCQAQAVDAQALRLLGGDGHVQGQDYLRSHGSARGVPMDGLESAKMKSPPLISVGLPVYNAAAYVAKAIESHLGQSYSNLEVVISDNGSFDATRDICESYAARDSRVRYFREERNRGLSWNHARVFALSTGAYFRWAGADDIPSADLVEDSFRLLQATPGAVLCVPHTKNIDESGALTAVLPRTLDLQMADPVARARAVLTRHYQMVFLQGLMRRDALMATCRSWDYFGWDFILLLELALLGRFAQTETSFLLRRIHSGQSSRVQRDARKGVSTIEPGFAARFVFPHWRWQVERLRAVWRSGLSAKQKLGLSVFLGRHTWWSREDLARDLTTSVKLLLNRSTEMSL